MPVLNPHSPLALGQRVLALGGARSGKSAWAESLVGSRDCLYVATARPFAASTGFDQDFKARIARHRARRPASWQVDETHDLLELVSNPQAYLPAGGVMLVDDLGTWLCTLLDRSGWEVKRGHFQNEFQHLCHSLAQWPADRSLVLVSPEVGLGVIPEHRAGRLFRDEIGSLNAAVAAEVDLACLVIAGRVLPLPPL